MRKKGDKQNKSKCAVLARRDPTRPYAPGNCYWREPVTAREARFGIEDLDRFDDDPEQIPLTRAEHQRFLRVAERGLRENDKSLELSPHLLSTKILLYKFIERCSEAIRNGHEAKVLPTSTFPALKKIVKAFRSQGGETLSNKCYENSIALVRFDERVHFVDGFAFREGIDVVMPHSWNMIRLNNKDVHFDLTAELKGQSLYDAYHTLRIGDRDDLMD